MSEVKYCAESTVCSVNKNNRVFLYSVCIPKKKKQGVYTKILTAIISGLLDYRLCHSFLLFSGLLYKHVLHIPVYIMLCHVMSCHTVREN